VRVTLGDFISLPTKFDINSVEFSSKYKFKIGGKELSWKPLDLKEEVSESNKATPSFLSATYNSKYPENPNSSAKTSKVSMLSV
jgi:hypothetical protein